jgi:hypothetical protein
VRVRRAQTPQGELTMHLYLLLLYGTAADNDGAAQIVAMSCAQLRGRNGIMIRRIDPV